MTRLLPAFFLILTFIGFPLAAFAEEIETDSKITAVTVYTNRAKIVRQAEINVPVGEHKVIFTDLPSGVLKESLTVEGLANADITLGAVSYKQHFATEATSQREKELRAELEKLTEQLNLANAEKASLEAQKVFLENLGEQASLRVGEEIAEIKLNPDEWLGASDKLRAGLGEVMAKIVGSEGQVKNIIKDIAKINSELAQLRGNNNKVSWGVEIPVETASTTKLTLNLGYQMQEATWKPLYDARLDTEKGDMKLVQFAEVQQLTGEDWNGVDLKLSTAQPQQFANLPHMNPKWVQVYDSKAKRSVVRGNTSAMLAEADMMAGNSAMPTPMESSVARFAAPEMDLKEVSLNYANIKTDGYVSEYEIAGQSKILSDGTETKFMIGEFDTESELQTHIYPEINTQAYLVAHMKLKSETPLLPGKVNLFRDGAYIGEIYTDLMRPDEEKDFSFGFDDQISISRKTLKDESSQDGMISKDNVIERHFVTEVQNLHKTPVKILAFETVPVSKNEKVSVEIIKTATTPGYKTDKDNIKGLTWWDIQFIAGEKKELKLGWKVSWPADHQLNGI